MTNGRAARLASAIFPAGARGPGQRGEGGAARRTERRVGQARPPPPPGPRVRSPAPSPLLVHSAAVRGIPSVRHDPPSSPAVWVAIIPVFSVEEGLPLPLRRLARSGAALLAFLLLPPGYETFAGRGTVRGYGRECLDRARVVCFDRAFRQWLRPELLLPLLTQMQRAS